jgi:NADH-quinone oxidoreductase subunit C
LERWVPVTPGRSTWTVIACNFYYVTDKNVIIWVLADEQKTPASPDAPEKPAAKPAAKPPAAPKPPAVMESVTWDSELSRQLKGQFGEDLLECYTYRDQNVVVSKPGAAIPLLEYLKREASFDYLVDVTCVHWPKRADTPFDVVYVLYSFSRNERLRVKIKVAEGYKPATAVPVHKTANWLEREAYDMFGVEFAGHPDLRRILMPEEWTGFPLRKDYGILQMDQRWVKENLGIESGQ